jgi:phage gp46-like protein
MANQPVDVKLIRGSDGIYDIDIDDNGDFVLDYGFGTTIALTIFGEQRATEGEVPTPENRRGWMGNTLSDIPGFEQGSRLWLLNQSRMKENTPASAKNYLTEALQWMIDDRLAKTIDINVVRSGPKLNAEIITDGESFYFDIWQNTN